MKTRSVVLATTLTLASSFAAFAAQNTIAAERGFTIAPNVQTPIVVKTKPDAACDLHLEGVSDPAHTMRLYANADGYVRVHASAKQESDEGVRLQLDCASNGNVTTFPIHLRASSSPTDDMPAPQNSIPTPKGSRVLPALTEEDARQLSDADLRKLGYPLRPDATSSPENYASWLEMAARPITVLASHAVSRSDIGHQTQGIEAGTTSYTSPNWSGYEAHKTTKHSYQVTQGEWNVPGIGFGESGYLTYSAYWVGIDGDGTKDLLQAGTEQNFLDASIFNFASYYAWSELLPNQPTEQEISMSINPADDVLVDVWVCDSNGIIDANGAYGCTYVFDKTQGESTSFATPLSGTVIGGTEAEWIMERPGVGGTYSELSAYLIASMTNAYALPPKGGYKPYATVANRQITLYNAKVNHPDNNELSFVMPGGSNTSMFFFWLNFH